LDNDWLFISDDVPPIAGTVPAYFAKVNYISLNWFFQTLLMPVAWTSRPITE